MKLVEHEKYKGMFYIQWPDGTLSKDFYNKTRAKEHALLIPEKERESKLPLDLRTPAQSSRELVGEFNRGARYHGSSR